MRIWANIPDFSFGPVNPQAGSWYSFVNIPTSSFNSRAESAFVPFSVPCFTHRKVKSCVLYQVYHHLTVKLVPKIKHDNLVLYPKWGRDSSILHQHFIISSSTMPYDAFLDKSLVLMQPRLSSPCLKSSCLFFISIISGDFIKVWIPSSWTLVTRAVQSHPH